MSKFPTIPALIASALFLSGMIVPVSAYAAMIFSPSSPQPWNTSVSVTCDTGDSLLLYYPDGTAVSYLGGVTSCPNFINGQSGGPFGDYTVVECLSTTPGASCDPSVDTTVSAARTDAGYISDSPYQFDDLPPSTPTQYDCALFSDASGTCAYFIGATTSIPFQLENPDQNLAYAVAMYFAAFITVVWLMRKH